MRSMHRRTGTLNGPKNCGWQPGALRRIWRGRSSSVMKSLSKFNLIFAGQWLVMIVLISSCLLMLTACSAPAPLIRTVTVTRTVTEYIPIDEEYLMPIPAPIIPARPLTWGDTASAGQAYMHAYIQCELQKKELRDFEKEQLDAQ